MKNLLLFFLLLGSIALPAQQRLFHAYKDSAKLITDANELVIDFFTKVKKADASIIILPKVTLNTQARQLFYLSENNTLNLPLWSQANPELKAFFTGLAHGNQDEGKNGFGLFFNGFYIARESGYAIQVTVEKNNFNKYQGELFANTLAILYLRESVFKKQLEKCYDYVNSALKILHDPVPAGENEEDYFNKNYEKVLQNPASYGYFQFSGFKRIYEDKSLPDFTTFLKNYSTR